MGQPRNVGGRQRNDRRRATHAMNHRLKRQFCLSSAQTNSAFLPIGGQATESRRKCSEVIDRPSDSFAISSRPRALFTSSSCAESSSHGPEQLLPAQCRNRSGVIYKSEFW